MNKLITLTILMFLSLPVAAAELRSDGNALLEYCTNDDDVDVTSIYTSGWCAGFITGVSRAHGALGGGAFCLPDELTTGQSSRVVVKYLEDHPAELHKADTHLVLNAFLEAFPCTGEN